MLQWYVWSTLEMQDRYDERLREIEGIRVAHELSLRQRGERLTDRALAALGHKMGEWGRQLEERHAVSRTVGAAGQPAAYRSSVPELVTPRKAERMVSLDLAGAAHRHMSLYSHSHRG